MGFSISAGVRGFIQELRRRRVFRVAVFYGALAWLLIEIVTQVFPVLLLPDTVTRAFVVALVLGFPVAVVLSWAFDITPEGVKRTLPRDAGGQLSSAEPTAEAPAPDFPGPGRVAGGTRGATANAAVAIPRKPLRPRPSSEPVESRTPAPERVKRASLAHLRHELRTPINAILGYSEMLLEDLPEDPAGIAGDLRTIHSAGTELLELVERILRPDGTGASERDLQTLQAQLHHDLREPISAVIGYAEMIIERCGDSGREALVPDMDRIRTAATRLLSFLDELVQITAGQPSPGSSEFRKASAMAEQVLARIHALEGAPAQVGAVADGSLLVVDDSEMNLDLISRQLARLGYTVTTAPSGVRALEILDERDFDVVLLDIMMPEMDGVEMLRRLRRGERHRELPVIVMSALDEIDSLVRCLEFGADDYLVKPVDPVLLSVRLNALLQLNRARVREQALVQQLERERSFSGAVLEGVFPAAVADRFRAGETAILDVAMEATVLALQLDGFNRLAARHGPAAADLRARLVTAFDACALRAGIELVLATGDQYLAAAGLPAPVPDHAAKIAELAHDLLEAVQSILPHDEQDGIRVRIGIHSGPLFAGTVGTGRPSYDFWGEARETALQLASKAPPHSAHVSPAAHARLQAHYDLEPRGVLEVPGRGQMRTYLLRGRSKAAVD